MEPTAVEDRGIPSVEGGSTISEKRSTYAILEWLDIPAIVLDGSDFVVDANDSALRLLETTRNELVGGSFFAHNDKRHRYKQVWQALDRQRSHPASKLQTEVSLRIRGREQTYLVKLTQIRIENNGPGTLVTFFDVSNHRAQQRAQSNLISTLSNELRPPLTSLSLGIELLQRECRDNSKERVVAAIMEDLGRIRKLSDDLLYKARDGQLSITVRNTTFGFSDLVDAISEQFFLDAQRKGVTFDVQAQAGIEWYGDPFKLAWVISSFIDDALRCTPPGGSIQVSLVISGELLRLSVSDSGETVPHTIVEFALEENTHQLTGKFNCGHRGLDLAIANEIVNAHRGRIFVETSSRGTTLIVDLPYVRRV
jgi:PAS domain S-box-containing protein